MRVVLSCVAGTLLGLGVYASAAPMLDIQVLTSTTGSANSYTSNPPSSSIYSSTITASPGTLYYEVVVQSAPPGTTNTNAPGKSPVVGNDFLSSLPTFDYTLGGGTFGNATLASQFAAGGTVVAGQNGGTTGTGGTAAALNSSMTVLSVTAISSAYIGDDSQLLLASGSLTVGSGGTVTVTGSFDGSPNANGSFRINAASGLHQTATSSTEGGSDPYLEYALTPEPASLGLLGVGGLALMRRRRIARPLAVQA